MLLWSPDPLARRLSENAILPKLFRIVKKIMLAILNIWLCLFLEDFSILKKRLFSDRLLEYVRVDAGGKQRQSEYYVKSLL